ncbi:MAG: hypothetical protein R6U13_09055, partial [Desulfatiglandaceae bacterium]
MEGYPWPGEKAFPGRPALHHLPGHCGGGLLETESRISYWKSFLDNPPNLDGFKAIASKEPAIEKIRDFVCLPWWIWDDFQGYPFTLKNEELKNISEDDIEIYEDIRLRQKGEIREWMDFIYNLFILIKHTINIFEHENGINSQLGKNKLSMEDFRNAIKSLFFGVLSKDVTSIYKSSDGKKVSERVIGRYYPVRIIKRLEVSDPKKSRIDCEIQEHFTVLPTENQLDNYFNDLDRYSCQVAKKYSGIGYDSILFGDMRTNEDNFTKSNTQYKIALYFGNENISGSFTFPVFERYMPLIKKATNYVVAKLRASYGNENIQYGDVLAKAHLKLWDKVNRYNPQTGVNPSGYFNDYFKAYFWREILKEKQRLPGNSDDFSVSIDAPNKEESGTLHDILNGSSVDIIHLIELIYSKLNTKEQEMFEDAFVS